MSIIYIRDHNECIYNLPQVTSGERSSEISPAAKKLYLTKRQHQKRQNKAELLPEVPPKKRKPAVPGRSIIKEHDDKFKQRKPVSESRLWKVVSTKPNVGRETTILNTKTFGKVPKYVQNCLKENVYAHFLMTQPQEPQPICRYIIRDYRNKLLQGMKENWEEMQARYQKLSIITDTIPKKNIRAQLEADMKQLESDIVLVERHPYIYVYPDDVLK